MKPERTPCKDCGKPTHLRSAGGEPLCRSCRVKDRSCLRCGKPVPKASMTLDEGVLCWPCSVHHREPKPCPVCGQLSLRLSRDSKRGFTEQVCEHCRRKGNVTCGACGKNRHPAGTLPDGRVVCKTCLERADQPFICPQCGKEGKPHSKTRCQTCYWKERAEKRFKDAVAMLANEWTRDAFQRFYRDLIERQDAQKVATARLERYFLFFAKLDSSFPKPRDITAEGIIAAFGAEGLRRHVVPYGFLMAQKILPELAREALEESSERRRQHQLINEAEGEWYGSLLGRFALHLEKINERYASRGWKGKNRRFIPRTVTADLRAASVFLKSVTEAGAGSLQQLQQFHLDRFLAEHGGYRAGISAFVRYLNRKEKLFRRMSLPSAKTNLPEGVFLPRVKYEELLRAWLNPSDETLKESLVCALMLLYAQPANRVVRVRLSDLAHGRDELYRVALGRTEITLDPRLGELLDRWLAQRRALTTMENAEDNDYLFPGRAYGSHLTEAAVTYYLKKHGVRAEQLFSTALFNAYMGGLRHPKVLVKAFGISDVTAIKYLNLIDPQLIREVNIKAVHV